MRARARIPTAKTISRLPRGTSDLPKNSTRRATSSSFQDVRGRFESEGKFVEMTPHLDEKKSPTDVDPSTRHARHRRLSCSRRSQQQRPRRHLGHFVSGLQHGGEHHRLAPRHQGRLAEAPMIDLFDRATTPTTAARSCWRRTFRSTASFRPQDNPTPEPRKWTPFEYGTDDGYELFLKQGTLGALSKFFPPGNERVVGRSGAPRHVSTTTGNRATSPRISGTSTAPC